MFLIHIFTAESVCSQGRDREADNCATKESYIQMSNRPMFGSIYDSFFTLKSMKSKRQSVLTDT